MWKRIFPVSVAFLWMVGAAPVQALPIVSGSTLINEDDGFPGVCGEPCYVATLEYEVWSPDDAGNPLPLAGNHTYLYKLSNLSDAESAASLPEPGIPITEFEIEADFSFVTDAGFIPGSGIAPTSTVVSGLDIVSWEFPLSSQCPACLNQGEMSDLLFIHSRLRPDDDVGASLSAVILDARFTTVGPGQAIPEPSAAAAFAAGLTLLGVTRRPRRPWQQLRDDGSPGEEKAQGR